MSEKDRVEAYLSLCKLQMERYGKTQEIEWRANFGIWTLLAAAIYLTVKESVRLPAHVIEVFLFLVVVVHCIWLYAVHNSEEFDKALWVELRYKALLVIEPEVTHPKTSKRPWYKEVIWLSLEVGMTAVLSSALFVFLTRIQ